MAAEGTGTMAQGPSVSVQDTAVHTANAPIGVAMGTIKLVRHGERWARGGGMVTEGTEVVWVWVTECSRPGVPARDGPRIRAEI